MKEIINFFDKFPTVILLLISSAGVIAGDFFAKFWSTNPRLSTFIAALIGYFVSGLFFIPILLRAGLV